MPTLFDDVHLPEETKVSFATAIAREPHDYSADEIDEAITCLSRSALSGSTFRHQERARMAAALRAHRDAARPTARPV